MSTQLSRPGERGHAFIVAFLVLVVTGAFGLSLIEAVTAVKDEGESMGAHQHRLFLAESGLDMAMQDLRAGGTGVFGGPSSPVRLGDGSFYTLTADRGDGTYTVLAAGVYAGHRRVIRAQARAMPHVFHHAIFAGNSSNDPDYVLRFEGLAGQADDINGDVYSGGCIVVDQHADVSGAARARGAISGMEGLTGISQPGFDFSAVDFSAGGILDVAQAFAVLGVAASSDAGGTALQLPESHPAHIFRLHPSDRAGESAGTAKDDYFLEDPYEPLGGLSSLDNGSDNYMISIDHGSGIARRSYFIDGNLWVHSYKSYGLMLASVSASGTQVTFIVKGNITFSDSFRIQDASRDAVGFVALVDPDVEDSGNIYMGDPSFGTLKELHAYLYAENDFLDVNLDAAGSKAVRLFGAMTAGDKVAIERTFAGGHSRLTVDWDQRLRTGALTLPFLDTDLPGGCTGTVALEAWVEAGNMDGLWGAPVTAGPDPVAALPALDPETPDPIEEPWWTPSWANRKTEYDQEEASYNQEVYYKMLVDQGKIDLATYNELTGGAPVMISAEN